MTDDPAPNYGNGLFGAGQAEDGSISKIKVQSEELWSRYAGIFRRKCSVWLDFRWICDNVNGVGLHTGLR